jgi:hypothetical protein
MSAIVVKYWSWWIVVAGFFLQTSMANFLWMADFWFSAIHN